MPESAGIHKSSADQRRPRKIWSCLECRRKKVQCDHGQPACGRCTRAGKAKHCTYNNSTDQESNLTTQATADLVARLTSLENRLASITSPNGSTISPVSPPDRREPEALHPGRWSNNVYATSPVANEASRTFLYGCGFRSKFNGSTYAASIAEHISGFAAYTSDAFATFSDFDQVQEYLNKSEARTSLLGAQPPPTGDGYLGLLLPSRDEVDRLTQIYFETFDYIYPVVHLPTFQDNLDRVWHDPSCDVRLRVLVLLVVAISYCLTSCPSDISPQDGKTPRDKATHILDGCDYWLRTRVQFHDTMVDFQISFLLLLARQLNGRRHKRTWVNASNMVRLFWTSGLNRDPTELDGESCELEIEMRRRLWASAIEFELQASFEHGMPAMNWSTQSSVRPPVNSNDFDLKAATHAQPDHVFTKCSYLAICAETLPIRHELNTLLNDTRTVPTFSIADGHANKLRRSLQNIPEFYQASACSTAIAALLRITIHQYILSIYEQQLRHSITESEKQLARINLVGSSLAMIEAHQSALDAGSLMVEILNTDHVRAALSICFAYYTAEPNSDRILIDAIEEKGRRALRQVIEMVNERVLKFGSSRAHSWFVCAAAGLIQSKMDPLQRSTHIKQSVDDFTRPFHKLMSLRKDIPGNVAAATISAIPQQSAGNRDCPPTEVFGAVNSRKISGPTAPMDFSMMPVPEDLMGWAFEDWNFENVDFLNV